MEDTPDREMTYGEKAVGITFNPANDSNVQKVKELYAEIIDLCAELRKDCTKDKILKIPKRQDCFQWQLQKLKQPKCGQ